MITLGPAAAAFGPPTRPCWTDATTSPLSLVPPMTNTTSPTWTAALSTTGSYRGDWGVHAPGLPVVSTLVFQTDVLGAVPSVPPARMMPSATVTAKAPARGSGSAAASCTVHSVGSDPSLATVRL